MWSADLCIGGEMQAGAVMHAEVEVQTIIKFALSCTESNGDSIEVTNYEAPSKSE